MKARCLLCSISFEIKKSRYDRSGGRVFCCRDHHAEAARRRIIRSGRKPYSNTEGAGHQRAWKMFPDSPCGKCFGKGQRHHIDGDPTNNRISNIAYLCAKHHVEIDGRADRLRAMARSSGLKRANGLRDENGRFTIDFHSEVHGGPADHKQSEITQLLETLGD